ncbi:hypothetical protein PAMP_021825 [Pampus punctatissimus]
MAPWGDAKLFFCILFITCIPVTLAQIPIDCCFATSTNQIKQYVVVNYHRQISGQGCSIDAMIFVTRGKRQLCVVPNATWVDSLTKYVDKLKEMCKKNNKHKRCLGVN